MRRRPLWLLVFAFGLALAPATVPDLAAQSLRVRKNIDVLMLDSQAYGNFLYALQKIKELPPSDKRSFAYLARLHNDRRVGPCEHGSELFLPWHRSVLLDFENALRAVDPPRTANVTLPYWDWSKPPSGKRFPRVAEDPANPLYRAGRDGSDSLPLPEELRDILRLPTFAEFGGEKDGGYGQLEAGPHNYMHSCYVGGDMRSDTTAAVDPLFWMFHAYIDLLWAEWQKTHSGQPVCLDCKLRGMPRKVEDVLDTKRQLSYVYEYGGTRSVPLVTASQLTAFKSSPRETGPDSPLSVPIAVPAPDFVSASLRFEDVETPATSYRVDLYIHPAEVTPHPGDETFERDYHAGYFAIWGSGGGQEGGEEGDTHRGHHPKAAGLSVDVSAALARAASKGGGEWRLTLVVRSCLSHTDVALKLGSEVRFRSATLQLGED
ncbi:MAG TPA: tyrosinase family protein [Thermoanaerobaculia bacterium]|nr:tyrosinase family protein [Thermoanaerobaculia bacterium]